MHIQTHVMSGWCVADFFSLTPRERLFAMIAASAADLDGLGLLAGVDYYVRYHHLLAHNFTFGLVLAALLTAFSGHRFGVFCLYLGLFHLHLILDYIGSGPGWGIVYAWPFSEASYQYRDAWELASWQNFLAAALLIAWTLLIAIKRGRTPLEAIIPSWDRKVVEALRPK